jgi:hypothetical protein
MPGYIARVRQVHQFTSIATITRTCLACFTIACSCQSPQKLKKNAWSLAEKQMWHHHDSMFAPLDHNEISMIALTSNSNRWSLKSDGVASHSD